MTGPTTPKRSSRILGATRESGGFGGFGGFAHLARRFLAALWPGGPKPVDESWAQGHLLEGEQRLWRRMSGPDRRHAVGVARRVVEALGSSASHPVLAAALLHDVGKVEAGLGTLGRVAATLVAAARGRDTVDAWAGRRGWRGRTARYFHHPSLGAALLVEAGSDELTVSWAREHHHPPERWSLDPSIAAALKAADDD